MAVGVACRHSKFEMYIIHQMCNVHRDHVQAGSKKPDITLRVIRFCKNNGGLNLSSHNSYVDIPIPSTSECNIIEDNVFKEEMKLVRGI